MNGEILDTRTEGEGKCLLCKFTLEEYIQSLPEAYQDYDIQRAIVTNVYLDHLVDTVLSGNHIPPIVLVAAEDQVTTERSAVTVGSFKILDGLQRTFRLQAIRRTIDYCIEHVNDPQEELALSKFSFSRKHSAALKEQDSNTTILGAVLSKYSEVGEDGLKASFTKNAQWFELWVNLELEDEIRKMLMLNAGHKPVTSRHQLELLFLNVLPVFRKKEDEDFSIKREKEISATSFSKNRTCGSFHFAHLITSLLSLYRGKPVAPSTSLIQSIHSDDDGIERYGALLKPQFLKSFIDFLVNIDQAISTQYPERGAQWMGREVTLSGILGGIGHVASETERDREELMALFLDRITKNDSVLALNDFEDVRNSLDLSKVNIGNVNRRAVFDATVDLLDDQPPAALDWNHYFKGGAK